MKKLIFAIAVASAMLFFGTCDLKAQDFGQMPSPEQMAQMQADQMKDVVKLTEAQYPKVLEIFKDQTKKMMDMMGGGMPDQEKMAALFKEQDDKLKKVLTEDQHKKWTEHMQQMMQNFGGGF